MPWLSKLEPGELVMRAPIKSGSVLIAHNAIHESWLESLVLQIERGKVRIAREGGEPLNVEYVSEIDFDTGEVIRSEHLLPQPVAEIELVCLDEDHHVWGAEELEIEEGKEVILDAFAYTISTHAIRRQVKNRALPA